MSTFGGTKYRSIWKNSVLFASPILLNLIKKWVLTFWHRLHRLRPRVLIDVSKIDMSTSLLGYNMPSPIISKSRRYNIKSPKF